MLAVTLVGASIELRNDTGLGRLEYPHAVTGRAEAQLRYIPVLTRYGDWVAFIDANTGDIVGFAPFDGFI